MADKLTKSDIYSALVEYARENERLIYSSTATYFAIAVPLAGVSMGAGEFGKSVQIFTAAVGLLVTLVWFFIIERTRRWFAFMVTVTAEMELEDGFTKGRSTLYERLPAVDTFIKYTPRSSRILSCVYVLGFVLFSFFLAQNLDLLPGGAG